MSLFHPNYRADVDGLRGIAILSVLFFHFFPEHFPGGFIGVDIFFVISGYLITGIILKSLTQGLFTLSEFYKKRIIRIFPALTTVLITVLLVGYAVLLSDEYEQLGKHAISGSFFVSNFVLWNESGYFDASAASKPLLHLWSLSVEEQFYLLWPLVILLLWHYKANITKAIIVIFIISLSLSVYLSLTDSIAAFYSPISRFWELMIGSYLAYFVSVQQSRSETLQGLASYSGLGLLISGFLIINESSAWPGVTALLPTIGTALLIYGNNTSLINKKLLANKMLVNIGLISYPMYLWHWPILSLLETVQAHPATLNQKLIAITLTIILAYATYIFIERPIRYGAKSHSKSHYRATALVSIMVGIAFLGLGVKKLDGLHYRDILFADNPPSQTFRAPEFSSKTCETLINSDAIEYCLSQSIDPEAALIGDSHALALYPALSNSHKSIGNELILFGAGDCPPFLQVTADHSNCHTAMEDAINFVNANDNIKTVYLTARFAAALTGIDYGKEDKVNHYPISLISDPTADRLTTFERGLKHTLQALSDQNKTIAIILDVPELDFNPKVCTRANHSCQIAVEDVIDRQLPYIDVIKAIQQEYNFTVIDPKRVLCDSQFCTAKVDNKILYRDRHHIGTYGSEFLEASGLFDM